MRERWVSKYIVSDNVGCIYIHIQAETNQPKNVTDRKKIEISLSFDVI
jgi:uncharacterized protein YdeI (BOF family)